MTGLNRLIKTVSGRNGVSDMSDYMERTNGGTTFIGSDVTIYQAIALALALELYANTGIKVNRSYTSTNMIAAANRLTGHNYRRGQYNAAALALRELANRMKGEPRKD